MHELILTEQEALMENLPSPGNHLYYLNGSILLKGYANDIDDMISL